MRNITGSIVICGVIGKPIHHTLSPLIHHTIAETFGYELAYLPFLVEEKHLEEAIKGAYALNIKGLNITMPHKKEVMKYMVELDDMAMKVGAVNTLVKVTGGYKGYNTDVMGLRRSLKQNGLDYRDKNVAIIGSGGAAFAAVVSIIDEAKSVHIFNRTKDHVVKLKEHFKAYYDKPIEMYDEESSAKVPIDYIIQTTGVGMGDLVGKIPLCAPKLVEHAKIAVDLIYNPKETEFLKYARNKGCNVINGFDMLFYQAVIAYELMHQCTIDTMQAEEIKNKIIQQLG